MSLRVVLDMLLVETGGVCTVFGIVCCTFILKYTASDVHCWSMLEDLESEDEIKEKEGGHRYLRFPGIKGFLLTFTM